MSATAVLVDTTPSPIPAEADEASHLRRLLERQPACLVRVGVDGVMMAVNEAGLALLGASDLRNVLGKKLTEHIASEDHDAWRDFAVRVWNSHSGSIECAMIDQSGTRRNVQVRGISLPDHPDGIESILIVVRDTSMTQRLQEALHDHEAMRRVADDLSAKLSQATAARDQLQEALAQHEAANKQISGEQEAERKRLTALVTEQQNALQQIQRESQRGMLALHGELERSLAEVRRLEEALTQATGDRRQMIATLKQREAERLQLEQRIETELDGSNAEREAAITALDQARAAQHQAEAALEELRTEHEQFQMMAKQREATRQRTLAEHATARMQAERALAGANARVEQLTNTLLTQGVDLQNAAKQLEMLAQRFMKPESGPSK